MQLAITFNSNVWQNKAILESMNSVLVDKASCCYTNIFPDVKPNFLVTSFSSHLFHKNCIDPWLLEHRTCPMCKCDILKVLGVEVSHSLT